MAVPVTNVSAGAYAWLARVVRSADPALWADWSRPLRVELSAGPDVIWVEPWPHDYWVSQGVQHAIGGLGSDVVQIWYPGRALDDWPLLEAGTGDLVPPDSGRTTNSAALDQLLAAADPLPYAHGSQLARLVSYVDTGRTGASEHGRQVVHPATLKAEVVRAWVDSVLGSALAGLVFSATDDASLLAGEVRRRLEAVSRVTAGSQAAQLDIARATEALYTARWENLEPVLVPTHQGQPISAADYWFWLGRALDADQLREVVQVAAGILVSPPVLAALVDVVRDGGELAPLGLCALRRWALGLRAMAWLEEAITHRWRDVRLIDVATFAFAAIAPWWPRPSVAISHRSGEVKPELVRLNLWGSAHVAIDAMTVPNRESNTGLVWRLFAATPAIIRIASSSYAASEWCRREAELLQYLVDRSDFFRGRVVADATVAQLPTVEDLLAHLGQTSAADRTPTSKPDFPPTSLVLDVPSYPPLIVKLLAAVGTLRLLNGLIRDVDTVNRIALDLARGRRLELPPPTNDPGGWRMHHEVFAALAEYADPNAAPVRLAPDYPESQLQADLQDYLPRIPDMRDIACTGTDVLAALEWNHEIRRWFADGFQSQRTIVDCRPLDQPGWSNDERHSVKRGMLEVRTETLVFIAQNADQKVDRWPVIGERDTPILTQHVSGQLRWMAHAKALPTWIAAYTSLPEFEFEPGIVDAAFRCLADEFAAHSNLAVPNEYSDVFALEIGPGSPLLDSLRGADLAADDDER